MMNPPGPEDGDEYQYVKITGAATAVGNWEGFNPPGIGTTSSTYSRSLSPTNPDIPVEIYEYDEILKRINQTRIDIENLSLSARAMPNPGEATTLHDNQNNDVDSDSDESLSSSNYQRLKERLSLIKDWKPLQKIDPKDPSFSLTGIADFVFPLAPPKYESTNEFVWLAPTHPAFSEIDDPEREYVEDLDTRCPNEQEFAQARQLIQNALKDALSIAQRKILLSKLETGPPQTVFKLKLHPECLPDLVENNPLIAVEVLRKLTENGKEEDISCFLDALINMEMSVHSMEVVNGLVTGTGLVPKQFLYSYISKCIKTCEEIQDKYVQNRLVRLLCVFVQSLIRTQMIDFQNIYIEILKFCVDFSRIRESAALFRLVKQLESEDPGLQDVLKKLGLQKDVSETKESKL